jgi:hypothetical protein
LTEITFNFTNITYPTNDIVKLDIDFNDNSAIISKEFNFNDKLSILDYITHIYKPSDTYHYILYYPTIYVTYSDLSKDAYQCPIRVAKSSFYSDQKRISIASCQFIDNSENSMFVTLENAKGDILNLKIK